jgi:hypothetical protein
LPHPLHGIFAGTSACDHRSGRAGRCPFLKRLIRWPRADSATEVIGGPTSRPNLLLDQREDSSIRSPKPCRSPTGKHDDQVKPVGVVPVRQRHPALPGVTGRTAPGNGRNFHADEDRRGSSKTCDAADDIGEVHVNGKPAVGSARQAATPPYRVKSARSFSSSSVYRRRRWPSLRIPKMLLSLQDFTTASSSVPAS